jgi:hypothetical protein
MRQVSQEYWRFGSNCVTSWYWPTMRVPPSRGREPAAAPLPDPPHADRRRADPASTAVHASAARREGMGKFLIFPTVFIE